MFGYFRRKREAGQRRREMEVEEERRRRQRSFRAGQQTHAPSYMSFHTADGCSPSPAASSQPCSATDVMGNSYSPSDSPIDGGGSCGGGDGS